MLQYSRIGRLREEIVPVNLNKLVKEVIDLLGAPAHIQIEVVNQLPVVIGERVRLGQVLQNLLSNAIKFMDKPQGWIRVRLEKEEDGFYYMSVADNGPGILEKDFEKIFQIFQTLQSKDTYESTGIGLTLVRKIVTLYGGKVWVESEVGQGSVFWFTLPIRASHEEKEIV
ncbi:MAG: ATP-binding protein [Magnetococcus sp. DMHC-6]